MKEKIESIIKALKASSSDIGALRGVKEGEDEDCLDSASGSIQDAIEELECVIGRN